MEAITDDTIKTHILPHCEEEDVAMLRMCSVRFRSLIPFDFRAPPTLRVSKMGRSVSRIRFTRHALRRYPVSDTLVSQVLSKGAVETENEDALRYICTPLRKNLRLPRVSCSTCYQDSVRIRVAFSDEAHHP